MTRKLGRLLTGFGLAAVMVAGGAVFGGHARSASPAPTGAAAADAGVPVQVAQAARRDVPVSVENIGTVQPLQTVLVRARVGGELEHVFFTEGQEVAPGAPLAQIDPRPYAAALAQAEAKRAADAAQLKAAQLDLARTSALVRTSAATRQQFDQQTAQVAQDEALLQGDAAAIASARLNLSFTNITAPIGGRVGLRMLDPGNLVQANGTQGIVTITQIRPIAVLFSLPQDLLPQIQAAMQAGRPAVIALGPDGTPLDRGHLLTIASTIDQSTGTIRLKAEFPNAGERLWPGQSVTARLMLHTLSAALTVPSAAVQHGPDGLYVYVVRPDHTVIRQPVTVTHDDEQVAVIGQGLSPGATVVVAGQSRLRDGTRVAERDAPPSAPAADRPQG